MGGIDSRRPQLLENDIEEVGTSIVLVHSLGAIIRSHRSILLDGIRYYNEGGESTSLTAQYTTREISSHAHDFREPAGQRLEGLYGVLHQARLQLQHGLHE